MKYYSDILNLLFENEKDLQMAEKKHLDAEKAKEEAKKKKEKEKKERKAEVEMALKEADAAKTKAHKLLDKFLEDYGSFSATFETKDEESCNCAVDNKQIKLTDSDISEFVNILTSFLIN